MDLGFLRPLYENPPDWPASGYVSVYLDTTPKENAPNEVGLRLRSAREALAAAGADQATLDAVLATSLDHVHARSHALFAAGGAVRLHGIAAQSPPLGENSSYAPLPHVVPWLAQRPPWERRAVAGLDATLTALRDGLVSDVLMTADPAWAATAWIGPAMADAATEREQLAERGVTDPVTDLAAEALARAAAGTGAGLHFLPADAAETGRVAALLRAPAAAVEPAT